MKRVCLTGVFLALLGAGSAQAHTTIIEPVGAYRPYQQIVDEALVETPDVSLTVEQPETGEGWCLDSLGCFEPEERTIVVTPAAADQHRVRETFDHELAHAWDAYDMQEWQRERFERLIGKEGVPWDEEEAAAASIGLESAPREWFAEAYSLCARLPHIKVGYAYNLTAVFETIDAKKLRVVCRMLGRTQF